MNITSAEIGLRRTDQKKGKPLVLEETASGCVICTSHAPNQDGYIRLYQGKGVKKRYEMLHRMTWRKYKGEIPDGYEVDHMCRVRACCNPEHLQLLTVSEHKSKTNRERYAERIDGIKFALSEGFSRMNIAKAFGVTYHTVRRYDIH